LRRVAGFEDGLKKFANIKIAATTHEDVDPAQGLSRFTNATQAHPKVDWIYSTYDLNLPPSSVPPKYAKAVYIAGGYDPLMLDAVKDGTAAAALPDYAVSEGYVGLSYLVES
jgi:ABC-type sugar transport system substrate-binding protein